MILPPVALKAKAHRMIVDSNKRPAIDGIGFDDLGAASDFLSA